MTSSISEDSIEVRAANDADRSALLEMMRDSAGGQKADVLDARWAWQWHRDPRLPTPGYRGVVAVWRGRVVANLSCIPAGLYLRGKPIEANWITDVRVHWGWARSALRSMARVGQRKEDSFPNGLATALFEHPAAGSLQLGKHIGEAMMTIMYRMGFVEVQPAGNRMRRVSFRWPIEKALGARTASVLSRVVDLGIRLPRREGSVEAFSGRFDDRFDRLWHEARHDYPAITRRDCDVLNWHYRDHPDTSYQVFVMPDQSGVRGYLVYKCWVRKGRRIGRIVDLLCRRGDRSAMRALVATAVRALRVEGAERVDWFVCGADTDAVAEELGFSRRLTKQQRVQPLLARGFPEGQDFYVASGDGDGG